MLVGVPAMLLFLPLAWLLNTRVLFPTRIREIEGGRAWVRDEIDKLGPLNRGERATMAVFAVTVFFWVFRPLLAGIEVGGVAPLANLSDAVIAVAAAIALFIIPVDRAQGHLRQRLEHRRQAAVGRADPVRRRPGAGRGDRSERRGAVHRQPGARLLRLAGDGGGVRRRSR